jgi:hypothetical protein
MPPMNLSTSVVKFSSSSPGDMLRQELYVTNRTRKQQLIEFAVPNPQVSCLRIAPLTACVAPGKAQRLMVRRA